MSVQDVHPEQKGACIVTIEEAARLLHAQLLPLNSYGASWETANPSERRRLKSAAAVLLQRIEEAAA